MNPSQVVIVSGGSRGLGAAIVQRLLDAGHSVATFSRQPSEVIERWQSDAALRERFLFAPVDAANTDALRTFVAGVESCFGRIDSLINNAGIAIDGVLATLDDASIEQMLSINLAATIHLSRECARRMIASERGAIINIASMAALRGVAGLGVYSATKAGVVGLTRALARELGPKGIRVNAVAPGYLETDMSEGLTAQQRETIVRRTPLGRIGTVGDVVPVVEFLLGDAASYVTGQVIGIDGGASV